MKDEYVKKVLGLINVVNKNIIITGQNMSGKTKLILELLKEKREDEKIYFISSNNRVINECILSLERLEPELNLDEENILDNRIGLLETGVDMDILGRGTGEVVSQIMSVLFMVFYEDKEFEIEFKKFMSVFDMEVVISEREKKIKCKLGNEEVNLSTGLKALIRLFTEVWHAKKSGIKKIFIDEVDMHIDQKNSIQLLEKLFDIFKDIQFTCVVHNISVVVGVTNTIIISLDKERGPVKFDSNEYMDIKVIARDIFGINKIIEKPINETEKGIEELKVNLYKNGKLLNEEIEKYKEYRANEEIGQKYKDILDVIGEIIDTADKN